MFLKQGDALSPLLFKFALEYAIRKVQENLVGLKLSWIHLVPVYDDDMNLSGDNTYQKQKHRILIDANKEVGLEANEKKTKYTLLSYHQIAGQNHDIKTANISFENVAQFKSLGIAITNQNLTQEAIKRAEFG
jgi:hypothetical protein